ncbi:hypothetical protein PIB30_091017 [Stylosanthes scabra]|uniref:Uncharacterized protein n=1 Tax=Stylosanthes scabra TaxID=79078 RepID=A0ABU6ZT28_9FABA|nr:hypothetical protein [Stylosanthes scabra]
MGHGRDAEQVVSELWFGGCKFLLAYCCVAAMTHVSSVMKFDIKKFDERMFFGLWQVQVNDLLIQSGLHKMRKVWAYCPGGASSANGSEVADVASLAEGYDDIL